MFSGMKEAMLAHFHPVGNLHKNLRDSVETRTRVVAITKKLLISA
jgi:hypothetical protein